MFIILVQQDKKDERNERYGCKRRNRLDGGMTAVVADVMITICLFYNIISALTTLFSGNVAKEFNDALHNGPPKSVSCYYCIITSVKNQLFVLVQFLENCFLSLILLYL